MNLSLERKDILTIPNLLSVIRLLLILVIVILYSGYYLYIPAVIVLGVSVLTDIADGFIARKFNMTSDIGKLLDPVADKLTQAAVALCLLSRYPNMIYLFLLMFVKEVILIILEYFAIRHRETVCSAEWHGKLTTVVVTIVLAIHMIWDGLNSFESAFFLIVAAELMVFSLVLYIIRSVRAIKECDK